jgi:hypothetical protein
MDLYIGILFGQASSINTSMMQYILPIARNSRTGETVKNQDLSGRRFRADQRRECQLMADRLAQQMTERSGDTWTAGIQTYQSKD